MAPTFAEGASGEPVGIIGSGGYLEIALNKGNAARTLGLARGAEVTIETA
jgi:S-adenosylmethionine hydrolase